MIQRRSRQRGILLNPFRFGSGGDGPYAYSLVWDHSASGKSAVTYAFPALEERIDLVASCSILEYDDHSYVYPTYSDTLRAADFVTPPPTLTSCVFTIVTNRLTSNYPAETTVYGPMPTSGFASSSGVAKWYPSTLSIFNQEHGIDLPSRETVQLVITAVVNGVAADGELRMLWTPGAYDGIATFERALPV